MTSAALIDHEAAHASAAAMLGIRVQGIHFERDERTNTNGRVEIEYPVTPEGLHCRMILTLAGLLESDAIPVWPLRKDKSMDERHLAMIAEALDLDAVDYNRAVRETIELTLTAEYQALHVATTAMCGYVKHIDAPLFDRLRAIAANQTGHPMPDETEDFDLDAELARIEAREAAHKAKQQIKTIDPVDAMAKSLQRAYAKADRVHRVANEPVEIKSFAC